MDHPNKFSPDDPDACTLNDLEDLDHDLKGVLEYGRREGKDPETMRFIEFLIGLNRDDIEKRIKNRS